MTEKLTPERISIISEQVGRIKSLDATAKDIGTSIELWDGSVDKWGEKVREAIGRNRLSQWTHQFLGQVVACAIINELMAERAEIAESLSDLVDLPPPPTDTKQEPDRESRR